LLACDPGLATFGAALIGLRGQILDIDACSTENSDEVKLTRAMKRAAKKTGKSARRAPGKPNATTEQVDDRGRRTRELLEWLDAFALGDDWIPPVAIAAEAGRAMGLAGSDAVISLSTGIAVVNALAWKLRIPVVWCTPSEWRKSLVPNPEDRRAGASEAEIESALGKSIADRTKTALKSRGKSISLRGHALDALGLGRWSLACSPKIRTAMGYQSAMGPAVLP
jgi:hypothetical protein